MVKGTKFVLLAVLVLVSFASGCVTLSRYGDLQREAELKESKLNKLRAERQELLARISEEELEALPVPPEAVALRGKELVEVPELRDIRFEFDKSRLTQTAREILRQNTAWFKEHPSAEVLVGGHCDERGTAEYNLALGDRRAKSTRKYLVLLGCDPAQIFTISYGEERPVDPGHNKEAWAKNRRAHFRVVSP